MDDKLSSSEEAAEQDNTIQIDMPEPETALLAEKPSKFQNFKRVGSWCKHHKKISIPLAVIILFALVFGVPASRYPILSLVKKQTVQVVVRDSQTNKPIAEAKVALGSHEAKTDKDGKAVLKSVKLGKTILSITKKYYKETHSNITVGLASPELVNTKLAATGRQVPMTIVNKISGAVVGNVLVKALGSQARSDKKGKVVLVVPAGKNTVQATLSLDGYNDRKVTVRVTEAEVPENNFTITPAGKVYFLSKLSGKIDVVKTNLDGSNRQTVVEGTGTEEDRGTVLLASRDWKYLALQSKRDSDNPKLYMIDTSTDKLTTMDEGNAVFSITGWLDHDFIYSVSKNNVQYWQNNKQSIKSYNAENQKLTVLDQTNAEGPGQDDYGSESYGQIYALKGVVLFIKNWTSNYNTSYRLSGKQAIIESIKGDATGKLILKSVAKPDASTINSIGFDARAYEAGGVYFKNQVDDSVYKYEDGKIDVTTELNSGNFYAKTYPTFLQSPNSKQNFWSEPRDGKNTLLVGDADGKNGEQIEALSDYVQFGWYTDDYLLVSKKGSELYILAKDGKHPAIKISDYHKPDFNYLGYGGGYGGI